MSKKVSIRLVTLGSVPRELDLSKIIKEQSEVYELTKSIESFQISTGSDGNSWEFSDKRIETQMPQKFDEDILLVLTNVPLEDNWYTRRLSDNVVIFTFQEIADYLRLAKLPLENVVYRLLNSYSLVYREKKGHIPSCSEYSNFTHDETKGCIYDMNGLKSDIVYSCDSPIICEPCSQRLATAGVSLELINSSKSALAKVRKPIFYRISDWVSKHPFLSLFIASSWSIIISLIASFIFSKLV